MMHRSIICSKLKTKEIILKIPSRGYNFASSQYVSCFGNLPQPDVHALRRDTLQYLEKDFDPSQWFTDPVVSLLNGVRLQNGKELDTVDAFGRINGRIVHANEKEVEKILDHVISYRSPHIDLRSPMRLIESELLTTHAGFLIGNQALDFCKQDGVTELEESTMANAVERRMNDFLLADEVDAGIIDVKRNIAIIGCVSNFSNFLDLFRKTIRNLEVGVPCLVLSRSNTTQHTFRWTELLTRMMVNFDIDQGMLTYASCDLEDIKRILSVAPNSPMYITCSRELASTIKRGHAKTISSTGGPNTLVATTYTPKIGEAIRFSATIENSGQCTALRHVVAPFMVKDDVQKLFDGTPTATTPAESLRAGQFAGIFEFAKDKTNSIASSYTKHPDHEAYYHVSSELPPDDLEEYWRRVVVDVTTSLDVSKLAMWLVRNQPISLAVNGSMSLARELFEKTGLVVYTVGSPNNPALTCQARPQESEIFGEFPPRRDLLKYTEYPVLVPSATAAYNTIYNTNYLNKLDTSKLSNKVGYIADLLNATGSNVVRGYCVELANYLVDAVGPKEAHAARSVLWGIQRPPINGQFTIIRCSKICSLDEVLPLVVPFIVSNAREQLQVSIHPDNTILSDQLESLSDGRLTFLREDDESFTKRTDTKSEIQPYNVITASTLTDYPMPGQFISRILPFGHIKSTDPNDQEFIDFFRVSEKWLAISES